MKKKKNIFLDYEYFSVLLNLTKIIYYTIIVQQNHQTLMVLEM